MKKTIVKTVSVLLAACFALSAFAFGAAAALRGDVDADGTVTAADARLALRASVNLEPIAAGTAAYTAADVTGDGKITAEDARLILRIAVGLESAGEAKPVPVGKTEYDTLRSGTFYLVGSTTESGVVTPMVMGVSKNTVYMEMKDADLHIGLLVVGSDMIFVNPPKKIYWKPSVAEKVLLAPVLSAMDFPSAADLRKEVNEMGFSSLRPLTEADKVYTASYGGRTCTVYSFRLSDNSNYNVYLDGAELLAMESVTAGGKQEMLMKIDSVAAALPTLPPKDYKSVNMAGFLSSVM